MIGWEYVAAFFDAEGSIDTDNVTVRVEMSQKPVKVLVWIRRVLIKNGCQRVYIRKYNGHHYLQITNVADARIFFKGVMPFIIVKEHQVAEALRDIKGKRSIPHNNKPLPESICEQYRDGNSLSTLAFKNDCSESKVRNFLLHNSVEMRHSGYT